MNSIEHFKVWFGLVFHFIFQVVTWSKSVSKCRSEHASRTVLTNTMECKLVTKTPYIDNKYLTIQQSLCLDPPLQYPQI